MSTAEVVLALAGLVVGVVVLAVVGHLLNSVLRPTREIHAYAKDILQGGIGIARNLDDAPELLRTRRLAGSVPGLAVAYLKKLGLA